MNYIVYGKNQVEQSIKLNLMNKYKEQEIITLTEPSSMDSIFSTVKFRPFFRKDWLLVIDLDKFEVGQFLQLAPLLKSDKVTLYMSINKNVDLFLTIRRSNALSKLKELTIINAKYPSAEFFKKVLISKVEKKFTDDVITYVSEQLKFKVEELDRVITLINQHEYGIITLKDVKKILPPSKTKDIKTIIYCLLLRNKSHLALEWKDKDKKVLVANANRKEKPFNILNNIELKPNITYGIILQTLKNMVFIKNLYMNGIIGETSIFKEKENLEKEYPVLKKLSIPVIREYIQVTREVTFNELNYCLNEFLYLSTKDTYDLTMEDIYLVAYKIMSQKPKSEEFKK